MLLTDEERRKFAAYCRTQMDSNEALAKQISNLSIGGMGEIVKRYKMLAVAYAIVLEDLAKVEVESIG